MEAVILAGGFGTRLRSVVSDVPKPMAPVAGRPFLEILLSSLQRKGFTRAVLALGYLAEQIIDHFGDHFSGLALDYVVESQPLGTGGATRWALSCCLADPVFVFNGDTFLDLEAQELFARWHEQKKPIIVARTVADTSRYGSLIVSDSRVTGFNEKGTPGKGLINAGCYLFNRDLLNRYPLFEPFSLESDFLSSAVHSMAFHCFETSGLFIDIGVPEDYEMAQTLLVGV